MKTGFMIVFMFMIERVAMLTIFSTINGGTRRDVPLCLTFTQTQLLKQCMNVYQQNQRWFNM